MPIPFPLRSMRAVAASAVLAAVALPVASGPAPALATTVPVPVLRMNVGGPAMSAGGLSWTADTGATGGRTWSTLSTADIAGTTADRVYRSERVGAFRYELPVPAVSDYLVRLHFAEIWFGAPGGGTGGRGSRIFSVDLEGAPAEVVDLDLLAAARPMTAVVKELRVRVVDGRLSIATSAKVDQAKLSAIEVLRVPETAPVPAPTPTVPAPTDPAPTDPAPAFAPGQGRPFADGTAYNAPLPANPVLDPASTSMVAVIARNNRAYANLYAYGDPVFDGDASSPSYTVRCTMPWGTCDPQTRPIRIPAVARPTPGSDGRMIIVDWSIRQVCDFWQARRTSTGGWEASWATCASIDGDGRGPSGGAIGAGINALAGVVRTYEIRQGRIEHALSFATDNSCRSVFRFPATKTDGASSRGDCIPEGARVQLDPNINVDAIPGITPGEKAVAKALQTYGAYNRDNAGAPMAFSFESPIGEADPYPAAGFAWDYYDMPHIPWNKLRVLRQWDGR